MARKNTTKLRGQDEWDRQRALHRLDIAGRAGEVELAELVRVAATLCGAPQAALAFVDESAVQLRARVGLRNRTVPGRDEGLLGARPRIVSDVAAEEAPPAILAHFPKARFFASAPLKTTRGNVWGALIVLGSVPHTLSADQRAGLQSLARQAVRWMEAGGIGKNPSRRDDAERFERVAHAASDALWDWDLRTDQVWWSEGVQTLFGHPRYDRTDLCWWYERIHPDDRDRVLTSLHAFIHSDGARLWSEEYRFLRTDGLYAYVLDRGRLSHDKHGRPVSMSGGMVDVTVGKQAEEALRRREEELEDRVRKRSEDVRALESLRREEEKLAAAGRMAARVAHEINNPLAGIKNAFLLVKDAVPEDHRYARYVPRIEQEIDRIAAIVHQMLELYQPEPDDPGDFVVEYVLRETLLFAEPAAQERRVRLELDVEPGTRADLPAGSLRQIVYNLVQNAIDVSPENGIVSVRARAVEGILICTVSDQGAGISGDIRPHVFEPFFTTKTGRRGTGLGLGLPVCRGLAEGLGGSLDFGAGPMGGTTFRLRLPVQRTTGED